MTTLTSAPIGSTGQLLDGVDVSGFFRESVSIGDPTDRTKFAPVDPVLGLTVNVASTVPQTVNVSTSITVTSVSAAVGQTTMASSMPVVIASDQSPVSINVVSSLPLNIATLPAFPGFNISSFTAGSIGVSSIPAIGISSFATAISISSIPAIGVSSFATAIAISSIPAVGVSSFGTAIAVSSMPSIGVSSVASHNVTMSSGIGVSSFGTAIAISSIPTVGISSIPAINVSSFAGAVGQTTMAFGIPVSIASNQSGFPVTQSGAPWGISAVGVSSVATAITVSSVTAATFPGLNVSTFSAGSIGVSSIPSVGVSSVTAATLPGLNVSSVTAASLPGLNVSTFSPTINNVQVASSVGGGLSVSRIVQNLATTNSTVAKAAPGQVYGWSASNTSTQMYMSLFNASTAVQISTAPLIAKIALQASSVANTMFPVPITFSSGIYYALTLLQVAGDNTAIAASTVTINLYYA